VNKLDFDVPLDTWWVI